MNLTNLQLYKYQASLCELLKKYATITNRIKKCLDFHMYNDREDQKSTSVFTNIEKSIDQEIENIDRFELRMAVVAPMKSGKSTIINALIGDNILPTRGNAMTTLPTEIVFNRDIEQPTLVLTKEAIDLIVQFQYKIQGSLNQEDIRSLLDNQSHLVNMVNDIIKMKPHPALRPLVNTVELKNIQTTLTFINDLIRIFLILSDKGYDNFQNVSLKPLLQKTIRLQVPVTNLSDEYMKDMDTSIGSLTIVDTPGPNEAAASQELRDIVQGELQKAALVILVLNFTSMGTDADQHIYEEIRSIREASIDDDSIYVIVNKVDQRRKGDMKKDDVRKFIATKYKVTEKTNELHDRRIFEMKAVHCLAFRRFMKELEILKEKKVQPSVKNMTTVEDLTRELYPSHDSDDDEEQLEFIRLCTDATKMWKTAGLKEFIEGPISDLFKKLAPRSIQSALNVCVRSGNELKKQVIDHQKLSNASKEALEKECAEIQNDCHEIARLENQNRHKLNETIVELGKKIDELMIRVKDQYEKKPTSVSQTSTKELGSESNKYLLKNTFASGLILGSFVAASIVSGGSVALAAGLAAIGGASGATIIGNSDDDKKFENETEAKKFVNDLNEEIYESCKKVLDNVRNEIEACCKSANLSLSSHLKQTTNSIIQKANERLQQKFEIEMVTLKTLTSDTIKTEISVDRVIQRYRPLWGYTLFGRKAAITTKDNLPAISQIKLQMSRKEIIDICTKSVQHYMKTFQEQVYEHFNQVLVKTFESYFIKLNAYFQNYESQVRVTLGQKTATKEKQEQYSSALKTILSEIETTSEIAKRIASELGHNLNYS